MNVAVNVAVDVAVDVVIHILRGFVTCAINLPDTFSHSPYNGPPHSDSVSVLPIAQLNTRLANTHMHLYTQERYLLLSANSVRHTGMSCPSLQGGGAV